MKNSKVKSIKVFEIINFLSFSFFLLKGCKSIDGYLSNALSFPMYFTKVKRTSQTCLLLVAHEDCKRK